MKELKRQFANALLIVITMAAVVCAGINFQQQGRFRLPDDGATWADRGGRVIAALVPAGSPADKAGIRGGDRLLRMNGVRVTEANDVPRILVRLGAYVKADYVIERGGVDFKTTLIVGEQRPDFARYYQYAVGLVWLAIGLFVLYRRGNAPKARHFYALCLASFVLSTFHYTGKLNNFDKVMYWGNVAAGLLAPSIFVHFCLTFPEARRWLRGAIRPAVLYLPGALLIAVFFAAGTGAVRADVSPVELRWLLDRAWIAFYSGVYILGGLWLVWEHRRVEDPIVRQQFKWLRNGVLLGIGPFAVFYALPYALGALPGPAMQLSVLSLVIIPLTWAYAVLRHRLMDVDIVFQQGYVYTLATLILLGAFYGLIFSVGKFDDLSPTAIVALILFAAFVFQPIRGWVQEQLDRSFFYKDRYDYRRTLIEFARELSSETDLDAMLASVADRIMRTLSVERVAFFLGEDAGGRFHLYKAAGAGSARTWSPPRDLDLSYLGGRSGVPYLFFERPRHPLDAVSGDWPPAVRQAIAELDLTYYVPCAVQGRTIAWIGVSRTDKGDFLTSDDVELLVTLSGYVGIAVENARLYQSLERKVEENERLREFNENIVESLNVGIVAAALDDRVESWNNSMEALTGVTREMALGQPLSALFPADLVSHFDRVRQESGIHHVYRFNLRPQAPTAGIPTSGNGRNGEAQEPADGREATVNIAIAPLVSRDERRIGRLIIFDDVTERTELERKLLQADKLSSIGLLAAGVAHEVNTPLAVISTYAQMLAKQIGGDEQKSALLDKIAKQTFRASEIVNSLLNFSRTSAKEFGELDLGRVIRETLSLIEHQLEKNGIRIDMQIQEHLPPIRGEAGKLQQVFLNLFLNARDAMERGGTLTVRVAAEERGVGVRVEDTGRGIPPEHLQRIYDPFFTTKAARKGTGLGLSVTYGIVREHGGEIEVESAVGKGTRFHLEFPAARATVHA
jgi:hypothetical protein